MQKLFVFIGVVALLGSCNQQKPVGKNQLTANQQALVHQYNHIDSCNQVSVAALEAYVEKMERASAHEPNEYKAMAAIGRGIVYGGKSSYERSLKSYEKALRLLKNSKSNSIRAYAYTGIGAYHKNTGDYPKALQFLFQALKIFETTKDARGISMTNGNIAQVYQQKNDLESAREHLQAAMKALEDKKWHSAYLHSAHTLANNYGIVGDYENALKIDDEGIRIADSIAAPRIKVTFLDNKANCFMYSGQLDSAQVYFNECLKLDQVIGERKQIADSYSNLGYLAMLKKDYPAAETQIMKSIAILKEIEHKPNLLKSYGILSDIYKASGKPELALTAKDTFMEVYKKMMNEKKEESLAEFKIVYETEKKEKIIAQNRIELLEKEREVKQRNNLLIGISLLAFFIALTGYQFYRQQKMKNRQQQQEHELKTAISQIETQNKLQEQRLTISRDLHDNIGAQLTFIISSVDNIKYAFDLKNTKLENKLQSINSFTKATIIELRDTIWAMNNTEITLEDLRIRIFNFIEKAKNAKEDIDFKFHIDGTLKELKLTSLTGMNIYRTIQEAINNAIKYANAGEVTIRIERIEGRIRITITDNGSGFDAVTIEKGNGLFNMQKRIEDIGGEFVLESAVGNGTRILIFLDPDFNRL